jgi:methylmalonyl-CoA/ethylmalonyl-CoA epimerase
VPTPTPIFASASSAAPCSREAAAGGDFTLDKLHQVALTATNLDVAVEFYRDILGLNSSPASILRGWLSSRSAAVRGCCLRPRHPKRRFYFIVDDIDAAVRELKKLACLSCHPPAKDPARLTAGNFGKKGNEEWMAFFKDPSGNLLGLVTKR